MLDWLLHDDQHNLFEAVVALTLNLLMLGVAALLLWPLGKLEWVGTLGRGYLVLWPGVVATALLLNLLHQVLRINLYDHGNLYIFSNLGVSCLMQIGWAIFTAHTVGEAAAGVSLGGGIALYGLGLLACIAAFYVVSVWYQGTLYRLVSLPVALVAYGGFALWPAGGRALVGWLVGLF